MMTAVSAASDASDGLAGAIHAPARTTTTDAMRFRFARMQRMVRVLLPCGHSPFEPLAGHSGMWSLTSVPDVRVVTGAEDGPQWPRGFGGVPRQALSWRDTNSASPFEQRCQRGLLLAPGGR